MQGRGSRRCSGEELWPGSWTDQDTGASQPRHRRTPLFALEGPPARWLLWPHCRIKEHHLGGVRKAALQHLPACLVGRHALPAGYGLGPATLGPSHACQPHRRACKWSQTGYSSCGLGVCSQARKGCQPVSPAQLQQLLPASRSNQLQVKAMGGRQGREGG